MSDRSNSPPLEDPIEESVESAVEKDEAASLRQAVSGMKAQALSEFRAKDTSVVPEMDDKQPGVEPSAAEERPGSGRHRPSSASRRSVQDRPASGSPKPVSGSPKPDSERQRSAGSRRSRQSSGRESADRPPSGAQSQEAERRLFAGRPRQSNGRESADRPPSGAQSREAERRSSGGLPGRGLSRGSRESRTPTYGATEIPDDEGDGDLSDDDVLGGDQDADVDSDASDDANEVVVLDPDHPLMKRFQDALSSHLQKQHKKVKLELSELNQAVKNKSKEREELGVHLYGLQQELARQQMSLEKKHDELASLQQFRGQCEEQLSEVRKMYKKTQDNMNQQRKEAAALQTEVENLGLHMFYMMNAKEDVRGDIAVMRRAAEKADVEVTKAEESKQKQDLYVNRLTENVDKLREEIALHEAQCSAQAEETKAAKEALSEARMEIESINLERKQLYQQWNSSLIGMRRRDEAYAAMNEALDQQRQQIMSLNTEIDGYKKSIIKEQERNETLLILLNKNEADINTVKKLIAASQAKQEQLKQEYSTYTRMLHETEQALSRATTDRTLRLHELNGLRKQIEKEFQEKVTMEDKVMETMRNKLTMEKASQYTKRMASKTRQLIKEQEANKAQVENEVANDTLEYSHTMSRVERLKKTLDDLDEEIHEKNKIITRSEGEIVKRNAVIERKQGVIDQFSKKVEAIQSKQGGEELGPLEQEVAALQKSIDTRTQEIAELQQFWLRQQSELVKMSKEKDGQQSEVDTMKKALTILHQKKMRIENEITMHQTEHNDVSVSMRNLQNDMIKLNILLTKEGKIQQNLQQDNILIENDFVLSLKEAEKESIEMQNKLEEQSEEKERLLNSLVEAERQIMLWEKKTQLAREAKATVDSDVGQGEIHAMTSEIHRMEVRYTQLMKLQEKLIQDMEKSVSRRDTIVTRGDAQSKLNKKVETKGTFKKKLVEMSKKIKQVQQDSSSCDAEIQQLRSHQQMLSEQLQEKQTSFQHLQSMADTLDGDIDRLMEIKQKNMTDILARQQKSKYYQANKDGKYTLLCKTESALETETQKQTDRVHTLSTIIDRLNQEFPHAQPSLRKITLSLSSRVGGEED
ncbi:coiled-coil domain-containing protein 40-like [Anneissia japonica]|uniref:coiled-coil domain-containing protein 40-like n=1 Tax=Anneissia japonica TaxID=1529436 RepID=UPI001425508A|nr:coiled-coil domain-containing protein 40-like [Anneissia japonica]